MLITVLLYFMKIGIPTILISYGFKLKYQEKYIKDVTVYIDQIKELDTENKLWETRYNNMMLKYDDILQENERLKINLGVR